jgi:hypothetical protein
MTAQGPDSPNAAADSADVGTVSWTDPNNIKTEDGSVATAKVGTLKKLVVTSMSVSTVLSGVAFNATIECQDVDGNPANPDADTLVNLTENGGGTLSGTTSGTIHTNETSVTITGIVYTYANCPGELGVSLIPADNASIILDVVVGLFNVMASEPTTQASSVINKGATSTTISIKFTNGNGGRRIVVVHTGTALGANLPVDGNNYNAPTALTANFVTEGYDLGTGNKIMFDGSATDGAPFVLTGLNPSTQYRFHVMEYNKATGDTGGATFNYKTGSGTLNPRSFFTGA